MAVNMVTLPEPESGTKRPKLTTPKYGAFAMVCYLPSNINFGYCEVLTLTIPPRYFSIQAISTAIITNLTLYQENINKIYKMQHFTTLGNAAKIDSTKSLWERDYARCAVYLRENIQPPPPVTADTLCPRGISTECFEKLVSSISKCSKMLHFVYFVYIFF